MTAVKVIKVMGVSEESWQDAAEEAFRQANQSVNDISGIKVTDWSADVENDEIQEYHATAEVAFPVHNE